MNNQNLHSLGEPLEGSGEVTTKRPKSTIEFPYGDLNTAIEVAGTVFKIGGQQCFIHQLAPTLGHGSISSGAFRFKFTTARIFGLIEANQEEVRLTELGRRILDENFERQARVDAFLHVPLYKRLFDKYKGYILPADIGLENEIVELGVTPKQKDKARQAFQRSAEQAGFFEQGRTKLVLPSGLGIPGSNSVNRNTIPLNPPPTSTPLMASVPKHDHGGGGGGSNSDGIQALKEHPLIHDLYVLAPPVGTHWPRAKREAWLSLLATVVHSLYSDDE